MWDIKKIFEQNKPINDDVILKSFYIMTICNSTQKGTGVPDGCYVSLKQHYNRYYDQMMGNQKRTVQFSMFALLRKANIIMIIKSCLS